MFGPQNYNFFALNYHIQIWNVYKLEYFLVKKQNFPSRIQI